MRVLVTGSTGFLGKSVVNYLTNKNVSVRALGRNEALLAQLSCDEKILCDLTNCQNMEPVVSDCDAIVHCAALSAPWGKESDFINININATQKLADAALKKNIRRFIHISSPSVYIGMTKKIDINESDPLPQKFINLYAKTKFAAEKIISQYHSNGLQSIVLRPQALFGPHDTVLLPRFLKANAKTGIPLFHNGMHEIDLTFVDNVAHAIYLSLIADQKAVGHTFNITNDAPVKFKLFIEDLFQKLNIEPNFKKIPISLAYFLTNTLEAWHKIINHAQEPVLTKYAVKVLSESRVLNIDKAKKILGYQPIFTMQDGVDKFAAWWKQNDKTVSYS